jgi:DNA-binding PadR family transcriptional regulator
MDFSQELVKGSIVPVVLALVRERAMYGYEMVKQVNARTGGRLEWREGTLYPALHRMESEGWLTSSWRDAPAGEGGGARQRKYYSITRRGRDELARRAGEWREFTGAINMVLEGGGGGGGGEGGAR